MAKVARNEGVIPRKSGRPTGIKNRRWLQFRLRTLLIATTVLAVVLGVQLDRKRRQGLAMAAIRQRGGKFLTETSGPRWVHALVGEELLIRPVEVDFLGSQARPSDLAHLSELSSVRTLRLDGSGVTDAGLKHVGAISRLEKLSLEGTAVTDAGLQVLAGLWHLVQLRLGGTRIGDAGLIHLRRLRRLEWLDLYATNVTDAGLLHLEEMHRLRMLDLRATAVTDDGAARIQRALPRVRIMR